jgi:AcrR family transcriptional regulator
LPLFGIEGIEAADYLPLDNKRTFIYNAGEGGGGRMRCRDEAKEKSIKDAVIKLILQEGFYGTSISKIAREAGISPATVYIYYDSKEDMLREIYREYSEKIYRHLLYGVQKEMEGRQLIGVLVRRYYDYIRENAEIFNFVDQYSHCPSLACGCAETQGLSCITDMISLMKSRRIIRDYHTETVLSFLFYPVKAIAVDRRRTETEKEALLGEMIAILQETLLWQGTD